MWLYYEPDCTQILIDLLCYEMGGGRLSPEMEQLLLNHLRECSSCQRKALEFKQAVATEETYH